MLEPERSWIPSPRPGEPGSNSTSPATANQPTPKTAPGSEEAKASKLKSQISNAEDFRAYSRNVAHETVIIPSATRHRKIPPGAASLPSRRKLDLAGQRPNVIPAMGIAHGFASTVTLRAESPVDAGVFRQSNASLGRTFSPQSSKRGPQRRMIFVAAGSSRS